MTSLSKSNPPHIIRNNDEEKQELLRDIDALRSGADFPEVPASCTRPSILRRLASMVGAEVPAGTDRLLTTLDDIVLNTAVSLHTGIPFASINLSTNQVFGEVHPGEQLMLLSYHSSGSGPLLEWVSSNFGIAAKALAIFGSHDEISGPNERVLVTYLPFQLNEGVRQ